MWEEREERMKVGIEVGGTFTDLVAFDGDRVLVTKVPSTPRRPDEGVMNALRASGIAFEAIEDLAHGSTVATNAVLERKGARTAFVTTEGFRDLLFLQRHDRKRIYDLFYRKPESVVARRDCFEVKERMLADGSTLQPLDEDAVRTELLPALAEGGYGAIAICLLNSYRNPEHERRLAELIGTVLPNALVACSHQVAREFREYERASTTVLSAFVQPVISGYLQRLASALEANAFAGRFSVMQSNGGRLPADAMRNNSITALFSGPAAGVVGAQRQIARSGYRDLITFDMGGTSSDVCLVEDGRASLCDQTDIDGLPVRTPLLDIVTVGAGGGSIVWLDDGGMLRVGPQSAGADPGPACYGRGGTQATITDAHVVCGTIRPDAFLGGHMRLDEAAARAVFQPLAEHFGLSPEAVAYNALRLANANIVRAIQLVSTERGRDPRDYVLVPYGGAGPLHAAQITEELGASAVVIPPNPGVTSAYGLLASDFAKYESLTYRAPLDEGAPEMLRRQFGEMQVRLSEEFAAMGLGANVDFQYSVAMRFSGQAFEVSVEFDAAELAALDLHTARARFVDSHNRMYMHTDSAERPVEIVSLRLGGVRPVEVVPLQSYAQQGAAAPAAVTPIFDGERWVPCQRLAVTSLAPDERIGGPAVLEDYTTTIVVPGGWIAEFDQANNLTLRKV